MDQEAFPKDRDGLEALPESHDRWGGPPGGSGCPLRGPGWVGRPFRRFSRPYRKSGRVGSIPSALTWTYTKG